MENINSIIAEKSKTTSIASSEADDFYNSNKKKHLHHVLIFSLWAMFLIAAIVLTIRAIHFIIQDCWRWLSAEKVQKFVLCHYPSPHAPFLRTELRADFH